VRYGELRSFAAKNPLTVENDRENSGGPLKSLRNTAPVIASADCI